MRNLLILIAKLNKSFDEEINHLKLQRSNDIVEEKSTHFKIQTSDNIVDGDMLYAITKCITQITSSMRKL